MWKDPICHNIPGPADGCVRIPIYVDLTEKEYMAFRRKFCAQYLKSDEPVRCFTVTRSELPRHYDATKSLDSYKCEVMLRWLFKL